VFSLLTAPYPSALACLRLSCKAEDLPLTSGTLPLDASSAPRLIELAGIDSGLCGQSPDGSYWFTPHGGPGVAKALRSALLASGFRELTESSSDPDFAASLLSSGLKLNHYRRTILDMLPNAVSPAALRLLLSALHAPQPTKSDFDPRAIMAAWPTVAPWLMRPLVVLLGPPNAGKSTLFNRLVDQGAAIVSSAPGTTRDVLTGSWTLPNGAVVELADMPGMRADIETDSPGEREGIAIAREWSSRAACRLVLAPCNSEHEPHDEGLHIGTMCDQFAPPGWADLCISSKTGEGLDLLANSVMGHLLREPEGVLLPLSASMALEMLLPNSYAKWFEY